MFFHQRYTLLAAHRSGEWIPLIKLLGCCSWYCPVGHGFNSSNRFLDASLVFSHPPNSIWQFKAKMLLKIAPQNSQRSGWPAAGLGVGRGTAGSVIGPPYTFQQLQ